MAAGAVVAALAIPWVPTPSEPPPEPPSQVRVRSQDTTATASWRRDAATTYRVEYSQQLSFATAEQQRVDGDELALRSLAPGTTYFLRVVAVSRDSGTSIPSRAVTFTTDYQWPAPKLRVSSSSSTSLTARWKSPADGDVTFQTQLSEDTGFRRPTTVEGMKKAKKFGDLDRKIGYSLRVRVLDEQGLPQSPWSKVASRSPLQTAPLRVASFNVRKSSQANWPKRRIAVGETIASENLDVVGLQEATPITVSGGIRQYADVVRVLGPKWSLTESSPGPTGEARTIYDNTRVELIDHGYNQVVGSTRFGTMRYVTWAIFEQKSTGKRFVFANTHFVYQKTGAAYAHRTSAAGQMVDMLEAVNPDDLPVVMAGDFNSGDYRDNTNGVYRTITAAGYVDPLGPVETLGSAEKRVNTDLKTVNAYSRRAPRDLTAPMVDNIFVTPMRVKEWETVARLDEGGRFIGTIPSDHNMIKATVFLP